ncbi:MAG: prepilin-type N-terminal cleavage/methylation domain-containing protein [Myxococcaceae bacterium]|jgi:prepilin-type N-terminal cleavage/methylation domain-containing protein|nr:prepilin-type N-terminal cleavage/methylation domain-containing protein [Myxococcaceae bacterium]MCA3015094.1 prepilin-type N-terminal cleavage/methylation domain-containing protein [Myxococcaceae bacterium]
MRAPDRRRGLTLIELMVSLAVTAIILAAVMSIVVTITRQRRVSSNIVDTRVNGRVALSMMQFDAVNAGYRFGTPALAAWVTQNVTTANITALGLDNCGMAAGSGWQVVPGTDVIEFREGAAGRVPGTVLAGMVGCSSPGACVVPLSSTGGNPFNSTAEGNDSVVIFSNGTTGCAGRLTTSVGDSGNRPTVALLAPSLRQNATTSTYPGTGVNACPSQFMSVTALASVTRYFVCRPTATTPTLRPALFRQRLGGTLAVLTPTERVQDGVEDVQVAPVLANFMAGASPVGGSGCTGTGAASRCVCNLTPTTGCTGYDPIPDVLDPNGSAEQRSPMLLRALRVAVTTITTRPRGTAAEGPPAVRPASFDHAAGAVGHIADQAIVGAENNTRAVVEATFLLQNTTLVTP